jgi:DNA-binding protein H-NS
MSTVSEVQQIQKQIADLQARAALLIMEGRGDAIAQIKTMMADYSIGATDLGLVLKPPVRIRPKKEALYADPLTGKTWTGQGAPPIWLKDQDRTQFLIRRTAP